MRMVLMVLFSGLLLFGCAATPKFDTSFVDRTLTPQDAAEQDAINEGKTVLWGGIILDLRNLQNTTRMEVLAYPLNRSERPLQNKKPLGRFILLHSGFLEPTVYGQGKLVSASGVVGKSQAGKIGESDYVFPVLNAEQIHLWSSKDSSVGSSFHIGIGIGF